MLDLSNDAPANTECSAVQSLPDHVQAQVVSYHKTSTTSNLKKVLLLYIYLGAYSEVSISSRSLINIGSWDFLEIIKVEYILRVEIEEMLRLNKSCDYNKCHGMTLNTKKV